MATRQEHLEWCKKRAMDYCNDNDINNAFTSFMSDLGKHEETQNHPVIMLGMRLQMGGHLGSQLEMKKFIEGTH